MQNLNLIVSGIISNFYPKFSGDTDGEDVLRKVLYAYKTADLSSEETANIQSIENLRKALKRNYDIISKVDFGAGSSVMYSDETQKELVRDVAKTSSKNKQTCLLLYHLIKEIKPTHALELGTCFGISCAYHAAALMEIGNGKIITIEGSPDRAAIANETLKNLHYDGIAELRQGKFEEVLEPLLSRLAFIDYAFIDGHHDEDATILYFNQLLPWFKKGGVLVFDDIFWSKGMNRAWKTIKNSGNFSKTMEYKGMGFGIII